MSWTNPALISCCVFPAALCKNSLWFSGVPLIVIDSRGQFLTFLPSDVIYVITHYMILVPIVLCLLKNTHFQLFVLVICGIRVPWSYTFFDELSNPASKEQRFMDCIPQYCSIFLHIFNLGNCTFLSHNSDFPCNCKFVSHNSDFLIFIIQTCQVYIS